MALCLTAIPPMILAVFIFIFSHNVLDGDNLRMLPIIQAITDGRSILPHLLEISTGHITLPTQLQFAVLTRFFGLDLKLGLWLNFGFAIAGFVLLLLLANRRDVIFVAPLLGVFYFSVTQDIVWLHTYAGCVVITATLVILTIWLMRQPSWGIFVIALITGVTATFSIGNGFLVWVAVLPLMWVYHRTNIAKLVTWLVVAFGSTVAYIGLLLAGPSDAVVGAPIRMVLFTLTTLGAPFVSRLNVGNYFDLFMAARLIAIVGIVLLLVNGAVIFRKVKEFPILLWTGFAAFGLLSVALIAYGRSGVDLWEARAFLSWYQTMSLWVWFVIVLFGYVVFRELKDELPLLHMANGGVLTVLLFLFFLQNARIDDTGYLTDIPDNPAGQPDTEQCAEETITRLSDCSETPDVMLYQASYGYAVFRRFEPQSVIGAPDIPVMIDTQYEWQALALRDWLLADADVSAVAFEQAAELPLSPQPLEVTGIPAELPDKFWYACTPDECDTMPQHQVTETVGISDHVILQRLER